MGCGASSGKGEAEAQPTEVAKAENAAQPPLPTKAPSGKKIPPPYEKAASLGRRPINDSFRVSSDRRSLKVTSDSLPPIEEANGGSSNGNSSRRSRTGSKTGVVAEAPKVSSVIALPPVPGASPSRPKLPPPQPPQDTSAWRPALQVPRLSSAPLACLGPPSGQQPQAPGSRPGSAPGSPGAMPDGTLIHIQHLSSGGGSSAGQVAAAAHLRQLLCRTRPPVQALLDAGVAAALVRCLKEGPQEARVEAAWALTNIAASSDYSQVEALCNAEAPQALVALLTSSRAAAAAAPGAVAGTAAPAGRPSSGGGAGGVVATAAALQEQILWALANIAGAVHPELKTQVLAVEVLDAGALAPACEIMEAEADAAAAAAVLTPADAGHAAAVSRASSRVLGGGGLPLGSAAPSPLLRCAAWCVHNMAKHKREKDMVDVIPLATRLLLDNEDPEVLACCAWVLAYLGSNEDNKSHLKQALPALPCLVPWVREAASALATPSLLCMGTFCTGYMRSLDYSGDVVEAGGVPAMLSYLKKANALGGPRGRDMVKEALFALSNVAGANNATVKAMLDAGVFTDVLALLQSLGEDEELRLECLYVLTNPWDPLVGTEVPTVQLLLDCGILHELHNLLDPQAPAGRLSLLLKGLADGLKRGQQLMTFAANLQLVELGREAAAAAPPPSNPVRDLYVQLGTVGRIEALNGHPDEDVATRANGILTVLKFM